MTEQVEELEQTLAKEKEDSVQQISQLKIEIDEKTNNLKREVTMLSKLSNRTKTLKNDFGH